MYVNAQHPNSEGGPYYALGEYVDGTRHRLVTFGSEKPLFVEPDMRLGFCEEQLQTVESNTVDLIIDDPPYGTTQADWDDVRTRRISVVTQ